jgi:hypothetical protein
MPVQPVRISVQLLPMWEGTIDSRFPYGFLDGSGIVMNYESEPAEWDHAALIYNVAKAEGWTKEQAQEAVRKFNLLVRRGERSKAPVIGKFLPPESLVQQQAYWTALGLFVDAYAEIEGLLFTVFRELGRLNRRTARALFANSTAGDLIKRINQLLDIGDEPVTVRTDLKEVLGQLGKINEARNLILHNGWRRDDTGKRISSNLRRALNPNKLRVHPATPATFDDMRADLEKIHAHFFLFMWRNLNVDDSSRSSLRAQTQAPWRYTPPAPAVSKKGE